VVPPTGTFWRGPQAPFVGREPKAIFIEVADDGAGIQDPFAALRPPALPVRGVGLWACHVEVTRLYIADRGPNGTIVTGHITDF
jgi:hypothetical protein